MTFILPTVFFNYFGLQGKIILCESELGRGNW